MNVCIGPQVMLPHVTVSNCVLSAMCSHSIVRMLGTPTKHQAAYYHYNSHEYQSECMHNMQQFKFIVFVQFNVIRGCNLI